MAITSSAKKAMRVAKRRQIFNIRRQKAMKDAVKGILKLVNEKKAKAAVEILPNVYQAIDKAAKKGVIKTNTAARMKSRISRRIKILTA
ncbi:MAG TPA: 30S ribosomal protein S20 [Candidatus Paceibacterota bacterium]